MENHEVPNPNSSSSSSSSSSENLIPSPPTISRFLGFRFVPTDEELILHLQYKIAHPTDYSHDPMIIEFNVYQEEPRCLPWDPSMNSWFTRNERYFFVRRKSFSGKDSGKRPVRTVYSGKGWWNANNDKKIYNYQNQVIGLVKTLTFFELKEDEKIEKVKSSIKKSSKRKARNQEDDEEKGESTSNKSRKQKGKKTDWIMHEYTCDKNNVREWVLCRIYYNNRKATPLNFAETSTAQSEETSLTCSIPSSAVAEEEEEELYLKRLKTSGVDSCDHMAAAEERKGDVWDEILNNMEQIMEYNDY